MSTIYASPPPVPDVIHVGPSDARMAQLEKLSRVWRGQAQDPAWVRPSVFGLVIGTAVLYLWNLSASGWANSFYAAAVKAGSQSWEAMFYGSLDKSNFITVDKPPASLWVMDLSARVFGFSSWSLLAPQAIEGALSVLLLYLTVRRSAGPRAGLLAGLALALTPISALMFRFNNPDALLVLLMIGAGYAIVRAVEAAAESHPARWVFASGVLIGFAFLTKMLQGLILLPALALVYLLAANTSIGKRIGHVLVGGVGVVLGAGWWVAAVTLTPASLRPYIGGSQHNSVLELAFGYNGIGRLTGADNNGGVGGGGGGGFSSGQTGLSRLFGSEMGTQISWLLPAALILIVAGLWLTRRRPRTDRLRAGIVLWGGWLVVNGLVFSYASGIIHPYYTVALAPPIAALVGIGAALLWRTRRLLFSRFVLGATLVVSAWWTVQLLGRAPSWHPELPWIVYGLTVVAVLGLFVPLGRLVASRRAARASVLVAGAAVLSLLVAPGAYALQTAATTHSGALPTAGPSAARGGAGGFGGARAGFGNRTGGVGRAAANGGGTAVTPGGVNGGPGTTDGGPRTGPGANGQVGVGTTTGGGRGGFGGGALNGMSVGAEVKSALEADAGKYTWAAAAVSSNEAGSLELGTNTAVMALGGFNGTDPAISLAAFEKLVAAGRIHYFYGGTTGSFIGSTRANTSQAYRIQQWVVAHYSATTVGSSTLYDLSAAPTS